jgi:tetratricopeptide (TPR) repeat protein
MRFRFVILFFLSLLWAKDGTALLYAQSAPESHTTSLTELVKQAEAKMAAQEWAAAASIWEHVVAANPTMPHYWEQLGRSRQFAKDYRKAIEALEKSLELGAGYPFNAAYNIACSYAKLGEKEQAFKWLEKAMDMGYRNLQVVRIDTDLKLLRGDPRFVKLAALEDVSKMSRDEGWRYDLWFLARELRRIHFDPFKNITRDEFESYVKKLNDDIPKLTDPQIEIGLMRLARRMGDGHTLIRPASIQLSERMLADRGVADRRVAPIELYLFKEGLFITAAAPKYADIVGARVTLIGDHPVEEVMETLDQVISQDNKMWPKNVGPAMMRNPRMLNGLGLIPDPDKMAITIRDGEGKPRTVTIAAETVDSTDDWPHARQNATLPAPPYLKNRKANYWFEYLPDSKTVYFQYNAVVQDPKETLPEFCERMFKFINENPVERLVIDMRWNGGGNNFYNRPIVHGLIRNDKIDRFGKLFVIVGRQTYSAAMCGATEIERHTRAIFVGEPTGSRPNFVGESIMINLPYSKMSGTISDLYWQNSVAMDYRVWIAPQLYAPPSFDLYRANRDPAMEAIMAYGQSNPLNNGGMK